jgi:hypothetical protein
MVFTPPSNLLYTKKSIIFQELFLPVFLLSIAALGSGCKTFGTRGKAKRQSVGGRRIASPRTIQYRASLEV